MFLYWSVPNVGTEFGVTENPWAVVMSDNIEMTAAFFPLIMIHDLTDLQKIGDDPEWPLDWRYGIAQDIDASAAADWNDGAGFEAHRHVGWTVHRICLRLMAT